MNVLFIGNSYTFFNDLEQIFEKLCRENGKDVRAYRVTQGGRKLLQLMEPGDPVAEKLIAALQERQYDVCFLQEHSLRPLLNFDAFLEGATYVCQLLKPQQPNVILYQTWARKIGSATLEQYGWTPDGMTEGLASAYKKVGDALGAEVSPAGINFHKVIQLDSSIELYNPDKTHPSYAGSCLTALTHYHTLFKAFPEHTDSLGLEAAVLSTFKTAIKA